MAAGRLDEAEIILRRTLFERPDDTKSQFLLALVLARKGVIEEAIPLLHETIKTRPDWFEATLWLSILYRRVDNKLAAARLAERACLLKLEDAVAQNHLGMCLLDLGQLGPAIEAFQKGVNLAPDAHPLLYNLGSVLLQARRDAEAAEAFESLLRVQPNSVNASLGLARAKFRMHDYPYAEAAARNVLQTQPSNIDAKMLLANTLSAQTRFEEAKKVLSEAASANSDNQAVLNAQAIFLQEMGNFADASRVLDRSLALEPNQGTPYYFLVQSKAVGNSDISMLRKMEDLASRNNLPSEEMRMIFYALGKAYEDLGRYEESWLSFEQAHRLTYASLDRPPLDRTVYSSAVSQTIARFTPKVLEKGTGWGNQSPLPIVVTGMIRSGTSLTEQILSRHPAVGAAGEQWFWVEHFPEALDKNGDVLFPKLAEVAEAYLSVLQKVMPTSARVTDKMPANYAHLGLIHLALPNARLIHLRRSPRDTCLSIFTTRINNPPDFAASLEDIVFAYQEYLRLVDHWRSVLPPDRFLEIDYEDLTMEGEPVIRRLLSFCELEWSDECLDFRSSARNVRTPSLWRVRQPLDRTSVQRWRRFEPWLGPLLELPD